MLHSVFKQRLGADGKPIEEKVLNLFKPRLSALGTNRREEEQLIMYWVNFIKIIEANISLWYDLCCLYYKLFAAQNGQLKLKNQTGEIEEFSLDFKTIHFFVTGAPYPSPSGFAKPPTIAFQDTSPYPRSNTCGNTIYRGGSWGGHGGQLTPPSTTASSTLPPPSTRARRCNRAPRRTYSK